MLQGPDFLVHFSSLPLTICIWICLRMSVIVGNFLYEVPDSGLYMALVRTSVGNMGTDMFLSAHFLFSQCLVLLHEQLTSLFHCQSKARVCAISDTILQLYDWIYSGLSLWQHSFPASQTWALLNLHLSSLHSILCVKMINENMKQDQSWD